MVNLSRSMTNVARALNKKADIKENHRHQRLFYTTPNETTPADILD